MTSRVKSYNKRTSIKHSKKARCIEANEDPKPTIKNPKASQKEVRPRLSRKAKKRLRGGSRNKAPLPTWTRYREEAASTEDIMKAIDNVGSQHAFVESTEEKKEPVKKVRKVRQVARNVLPVLPALTPTLPVKTVIDASSKAPVRENVMGDFQRKSRAPRRRPITLCDFMLRTDMHLDTYVQTYRV